MVAIDMLSGRQHLMHIPGSHNVAWTSSSAWAHYTPISGLDQNWLGVKRWNRPWSGWTGA